MGSAACCAKLTAREAGDGSDADDESGKMMNCTMILPAMSVQHWIRSAGTFRATVISDIKLVSAAPPLGYLEGSRQVLVATKPPPEPGLEL